jgi:hypothetical protein
MDSVQNTQSKLHDLVIELTKRGKFHGQAARSCYLLYCHRMVVNSSARWQAGYVMPGCTKTKVVADSIGVTPRAVQMANVWLEENGFIIRYPDGLIEIRVTSEEDEEIRMKWVEEQHRRERASRKKEVASQAREDSSIATVSDLRKRRPSVLTSSTTTSGEE